MPLTLKLKNGQKVIINGAVIENSGPPATMVVHNNANILRDKDVLTEQEAKTPASLVYYALQCAYLFEDNRVEFLERFEELIRDYVSAAPSATPLAVDILTLAGQGDLYGALRTARKLREHEDERLGAVLRGG
jgi:flagellar protein FlbT